MDLAGSCGVHLVGGTGGLVASVMLGARLGRWQVRGKPPMGETVAHIARISNKLPQITLCECCRQRDKCNHWNLYAVVGLDRFQPRINFWHQVGKCCSSSTLHVFISVAKNGLLQ